MAVELVGGQNIALANSLGPQGRVTAVIEWDSPPDFDIDASAFLLTDAEIVRSSDDFVFYNQPNAERGAVQLISSPTSSNSTGFQFDLHYLPKEVQKIALTLTIYGAEVKQQHLGLLQAARLRLGVALQGAEIAYYDCMPNINRESALIIGQLYRHGDSWKFRALGQGFNGGLEALARNYKVDLSDDSSAAEAPAKQLEAAATVSAEPLPTAVEAAVSTERETRSGLQQLLAEQATRIESELRKLLPRIEQAKKQGVNESGTRMLLDQVLQSVLGLGLEHIKTEQNIQGGRADYVINVNKRDVLVIEAKAITISLKTKHVAQAAFYSAYSGIRWALLTNGLDWQLYRVVTGGKVLRQELVFSVNLNNGVTPEIAQRLALLSYTSLTQPQKTLEVFWKQFSALSAENLLKVLLDESVVEQIRQLLSKQCELGYQDVHSALKQHIVQPLR